MDGVSRPSGAAVPLTVKEGPWAGTWLLGGMELADYGTVEQELLRRRKSPLDAIADQLEKVKSPRIQQMLVRMAYNDMRKDKDSNKVPVQDVYDWLDSVEGLIFTTWLCLKKNHPQVTIQDAEGIMNAIGRQELLRLRDQASGTDVRGNSTGPNQEETGPTSAEGNGFPGGVSTDVSPSITAGDPNKSTD